MDQGRFDTPHPPSGTPWAGLALATPTNACPVSAGLVVQLPQLSNNNNNPPGTPLFRKIGTDSAAVYARYLR